MLRCVAKVLNYQREHGTPQLIGSCFGRLKNTLFFYQKEVVGCLSVVDFFPCARPKISVIIRPAEIADIPELKLLTSDYKKRDFLQWINSNYIFYIAQLSHHPSIGESPSISVEKETQNRPITLEHFSGERRSAGFEEKIIGYVCVCPAKKSTHKLVSILKLEETDYWAVDAYTHPVYRGRGVNSAIAPGFLAQAKREGFKRGYGTILFSNNSSRNSYASIGEKEIGIFTTITILGLTFYFLKKNKGFEVYFNG